jgi:hypothetical protein
VAWAGGAEVATAAKTAVSVRFGVGKVNGVGEAAPGNVHEPTNPAARLRAIRVRRFGIPASDPTQADSVARFKPEPGEREVYEPRGGAGGSRTHTRSPSEDFKSPASAYSATAPLGYCISGGRPVKPNDVTGVSGCLLHAAVYRAPMTCSEECGDALNIAQEMDAKTPVL